MKTLRYSQRGPLVEMAQLALQRAGVLSDDIDGIFGNQTQSAVIAWQTSRGLTPDGIIGPATWQSLAPYIKGYVSHRVIKGDTLFTLARQYGTTLSAIQTANPTLDPRRLTVGSWVTVPLSFPLVPIITYSSHLLDWVVEGLTARYPFIRLSTIGHSVLGKPLYLLTMGQGSKQVSFNAAHHGNEWLTTPVVLTFLEQYADSVIRNRTIGGISATELFSRTTLFALPMVNPDGVDLATATLTQGAAYTRAKEWAADYPQIPFPQGWKANINGVDLNLQYPADWQQAKENKFALGYRTPGPRDYVGRGPLTQPEAVAVANLTRRQDFALILAYHSQGEIIYYRYKDYDPPRADAIGRLLSEASGYSLEITPYASGFAGYKDWFIQTRQRPGYTIEVGKGVNPLPIQQFETIYADNVGLMATALQQA